ncbi:MAG: J domain-containing protein, partial [Pirellulales bacterium]
MVRLGLLPPYSAEDVKQAYLEKVKTAHPDVGGSVKEFVQLQEAYQQATEYVEFRASRMSWLGSHMQRYVRQTEVVDTLTEWGARLEFESVDWLERSFGDDFAQIMETIVGIDLSGQPVGDAEMEFLVREHAVLHRLHQLDLRQTRVGNHSLGFLRIYGGLRRLDLRGAPATVPALKIARWFPKLQWLGIDRRGLSPVARLRLRWSRPR